MSPSVWVPEELQAVAEQVRSGARPRATVRTLLAWFKAERRGGNVVAQIHRALGQLGLATTPSFEGVWIDAPVTFQPFPVPEPAPTAEDAPAAEAPPAAEARVEAQTPSPPAADAGGASAVALTHEAPAQEPPATPPADQTRQAPALAAEEPPAASAPAAVSGPVLAAASPLAAVDPVHRVGKLDAANRVPATVAPDAPLTQAMTRMLASNLSQLPVLSGGSSIRGVISWRSIGQRIALRGTVPSFVRECLEEGPLSVCGEDDDLFQVVRLVAERGYVLVLRRDRKLSGVVTQADLTLQFGALVEPFVLVGEIENHLRLLLDKRLPVAMLQAARDPRDNRRTVERAADLTFGEYVRLLERPETWQTMGMTLDRGSFIDALDRVREVRNDVAHFNPEGLDPSDLRILRDFVRFLRTLTDSA